MSTGTKIQWSEATWNPVSGCTRVSAGCDHCYAVKTTHRLASMGQAAKYGGLTVLNPKGDRHFNGQVRCHDDALTIPLGWKKPRKIFVNSMSDLFHKGVPFDFVDKVFDVMWNTPRHTYQILTKRPERLAEYVTKRAAVKSHGWTDTSRPPFTPGDFIHFDDVVMRNECGYHGSNFSCHHPSKGKYKGKEDSCDSRECPIFYQVSSRAGLKKIGVADQYEYDRDGHADSSEWMELHSRPMHAACRNAWLGFSAENQQVFDERFTHFESLRWQLGPEFVFFMSLEPLLGPIDIRPALKRHHFGGLPAMDVPHINWVIVGGESGPKSRPLNLRWIRSIVQQCKAAGVPVFVKQLGTRPCVPSCASIDCTHPDCETKWLKLNDRKGGDMAEWPADLRVRQFPESNRPSLESATSA